MKFSLIAKPGWRSCVAVTLIFYIGTAAAQNTAACLSSLGEGDALTPETQALIQKIEAVAHGPLLDTPWTTSVGNQRTPGGDTVFKFIKSDDDGSLLVSIKDMTDKALDQMAIDNGIVDIKLPVTNTVLVDARTQIRTALSNDSVEFNASICLAKDDKSFAVDLVGVDDTPTAGMTGTLNAISQESGKGVHVEGQIAKKDASTTEKPSSIAGDFSSSAQ